MKKLGQHFLKNTAALDVIAKSLAVAKGDHIVEIGPGHGELTVPLIRAAQGKRCAITCIEKDHALIAGMEEMAARENSAPAAGGEGTVRITIAEGDALKLLPNSAATKIVGNIPYYITGKLLRVISELDRKPERVVLLIQEEVAERICAAPPAMNRLAASVQFWADAEIVALVPRKDFSPPPEVDSAVIMLRTKTARAAGDNAAPGIKATPVSADHYYRAVRTIFAQPRKTLLNNLAGNAPKDVIAAHLGKIGIDPGARPQDLSIEQIIAVAKAPIWG